MIFRRRVAAPPRGAQVDIPPTGRRCQVDIPPTGRSTAAGCRADIPRKDDRPPTSLDARRVAAAARPRNIPPTSRSGAAADTWISRGHEARRSRGRDVEISQSRPGTRGISTSWPRRRRVSADYPARGRGATRLLRISSSRPPGRPVSLPLAAASLGTPARYDSMRALMMPSGCAARLWRSRPTRLAMYLRRPSSAAAVFVEFRGVSECWRRRALAKLKQTSARAGAASRCCPGVR